MQEQLRDMDGRADSESRSRHIPKAVVSELLEKARHRCCLCRVLIDPERFDGDALFGSLEKHHIHQFSEGGGHTYENLVLVCANCHGQIHKHPEKYPVGDLREKKRHWVQMIDVVPAELGMPNETEDVISIPFAVVSLNLKYSILASPQATVADLTLFVGENILEPLGRYDDHENWLEPEELGLGREPATEKLDPDLRLGEVRLAPDDVLTARVPKIVIPVVIPPVPDFATREHLPVPEMVTIPAGRFWMGTDKLRWELAGLWWSDWMMAHEAPYHQVYLPKYEIGKYPVTNSQYAAFVKATDHPAPRNWGGGKIPRGKENHPVIWVSWYDAMAYCRWLSKRTGGRVLLPSEAEWEKAARGTNGRIYPWGNGPPTAALCSFELNVRGTTPVGQYSAAGDSPYGCADMAGNVWEWTRSLYRDYPYNRQDGRENLEVGGKRVLRGGSFDDSEYHVRCACRFRYKSNDHWFGSGFRVVVAPFSPIWYVSTTLAQLLLQFREENAPFGSRDQRSLQCS